MTIRQVSEAVIIGIVITAIPAVGWEGLKIATKLNAAMNAVVRMSYSYERMEQAETRAAVALEHIAEIQDRKCLPRPSVLDGQP